MNAEVLADVLNRISPKNYYRIREVMEMADYSYWYREGKTLIVVMADGANVICRNNQWTVQR